ncbi:hypothetical protein NDU88_004068 [Pleurodeles waltl]|uniref:Uncharacterized protein n=1 Tax=Pleurodeles waltl TaxID=8319 RepID=A0AAV7SHP3_PLEWA|nr:hypothetical protein NDU88_004068 [Pleurodeles waltl]
MSRHCRLRHTPGAPTLRRFPTRKSSGREPIGLAFWVTAGRNRPFAPSPGKEDEKAGKEGECDGPTLPVPSYPRGTNTEEVPDLEVLRSGTNRVGLPGDGRQKQALHAITREGRREGGERRSGDCEREGGVIGEEEGGGRPEDREEGRGSLSSGCYSGERGRYRNTAAERDAAEHQEALHQNPSHALVS